MVVAVFLMTFSSIGADALEFFDPNGLVGGPINTDTEEGSGCDRFCHNHHAYKLQPSYKWFQYEGQRTVVDRNGCCRNVAPFI